MTTPLLGVEYWITMYIETRWTSMILLTRKLYWQASFVTDLFPVIWGKLQRIGTTGRLCNDTPEFSGISFELPLSAIWVSKICPKLWELTTNILLCMSFPAWFIFFTTECGFKRIALYYYWFWSNIWAIRVGCPWRPVTSWRLCCLCC